MFDCVADVFKQRGPFWLHRYRREQSGGFVDFVNAIHESFFDDGALAAAPIDFDVQVLRGAGGEDAHGVIARKITAARNDFLTLPRGAAANFYFGANAASVKSGAFQAYGDARRGGVVAINPGRFVQVVDDEIEVAVVVEIRESHAVGNARRIKAPRGSDLFESEITAVAESQFRRGEAREKFFETKTFDPAQPLARFSGFDRVDEILVKRVGGKAGGDEQVFIPVEIDIEKKRCPRP